MKNRNRYRWMESLAVVLAFAASLALMSAPAWAGKESHGGGLHYCKDRPNPIEFYDLYEGRDATPKNPIPVLPALSMAAEEYEAKVLSRIERVNPFFALEVAKWLGYLRAPGNLVPVHQSLRKIQDANYLWVDKGCEYLQLANWDDRDETLYVDSEFYPLLQAKPRDFLAFQFHEAIYKASRILGGQTNSDLTRKWVAYLFSNAEAPDLFAPLYRSAAFAHGSGPEMSIRQEGTDLIAHLGKIGMADLEATSIRIVLVNSGRQERDRVCEKWNALPIRLKIRKKFKRQMPEVCGSLSFEAQGYLGKGSHWSWLTKDRDYRMSVDFSLSNRDDVSLLSEMKVKVMQIWIRRFYAEWTAGNSLQFSVPFRLRIEKWTDGKQIDSAEADFKATLEGDWLNRGEVPLRFTFQ